MTSNMSQANFFYFIFLLVKSKPTWLHSDSEELKRKAQNILLLHKCWQNHHTKPANGNASWTFVEMSIPLFYLLQQMACTICENDSMFVAWLSLNYHQKIPTTKKQQQQNTLECLWHILFNKLYTYNFMYIYKYIDTTEEKNSDVAQGTFCNLHHSPVRHDEWANQASEECSVMIMQFPHLVTVLISFNKLVTFDDNQKTVNLPTFGKSM